MTKKIESAKSASMTGPAAKSVSRIDLEWMSGTKEGVAAAAAAGDAATDGVVVTVWANNGVPIARAISGSKFFMPKVF